MKPSTRLSSAVFQLTPTRTRCDLIIISNDKKEKIASGLLNPFLAHLKTAQDQTAKGGYSIVLEPEPDDNAAWFTKATVVRFVRFVSTPEILERVYTIESEILQMEEAIAFQRSNDIGQSIVEDHHQKPIGGSEGDKSMASPNAGEEKAIVLYKPGASPAEANGSGSQEGNSKAQLLKVLEARRTMLHKEQGMAFARAAAAGFDVDQMAQLVSFAKCFGAFRLMEACSKFMGLWKTKHDTGQWLDIEASEALSTQSDFSQINASGIVLSVTPSKDELASENGKSGTTNDADNPVPNGQQAYFQGQFPHLVFPPWPMHAPPGAQPVFQAYPVQGMPYYQTYAGNGPFFPPHVHPMENSPSNFSHQSGQKGQSPNVRDSYNGSETWESDRARSSDETASDAEVSQSRKPRRRSGGSKQKNAGVVVIRNINYITNKDKKSGSGTTSDSHLDTDAENEYIEADDDGVIHHNSKGYSKSRGSHLKSADNDEVSILEKDTDDRHWQAFQNCLLRGNDEDAHADNGSIYGVEKGVKIKRRSNTVSDDPLSLGALGRGETQDSRMRDISRISGSMSHRPRGSGDEVIFSSADGVFRGNSDQADIQFSESNGRNILSRTANEDFMFSSQNGSNFRNSSDPLAVNSFEGSANKMDREGSNGMADENIVVPFRSMSLDRIGGADRTAIDMDCEIPPAHRKLDSEGNRNKINYEPDDLSLMPERGVEKRPSGYDLALDYEMQVCAKGSGAKDGSDVKGGLRKSEKDRRKVSSDPSHKQRTGGPIRKIKPSKMSPLEDARARAERLRSYKADLQKMKKEKEEEAAKRLQALKLERQKRIAARGGSTSVKPSVPSQTKQIPAKISPATNRGSKFSDSEPGLSSPLQRSKIRMSLGSTKPLKSSKDSKVSEGSQIAGNRLTRSSSSLSDPKREGNGVTPDSKASMARIRRLSEPKTNSKPPVTSIKSRSAEAVSKKKLSEGPERKKVSAIINLDRSKAATLPELKIKTSKSHVNAEEQIDADDNPIVEKTVVMLECHKPSLPTLHSSEGKSEVQNQLHHDRGKGDASNGMSEIIPVHATASSMNGFDRKPIPYQLPKKPGSSEVRPAYSEKSPPDFANIPTAERTYHAPYARVSSLEDPSTRKSEYGKAPAASSELLSREEETAKAYVPDVKSLKMEKNVVTSEKASVKEVSKGLSRLLKFGKKNHTSSSVDQSVDSQCTSYDGSEHDDNARKATSNEVKTLKNLISQDETASGGNDSQKKSRHFSILSPFRIKTSEKKQAS